MVMRGEHAMDATDKNTVARADFAHRVAVLDSTGESLLRTLRSPFTRVDQVLAVSDSTILVGGRGGRL